MIGRIASRGNVERTCNAILLEFVGEPRVKRRRRLLIERYYGLLAAAIGREIDLARIKRKPLAIDVGRDTQARLPLAGTQPVLLVVVIRPLEFATAADVVVVFRAATPLGMFLHSSLHYHQGKDHHATQGSLGEDIHFSHSEACSTSSRHLSISFDLSTMIC